MGLHASFALDMRLDRPKPHCDEHSDHGVTNASQFGGLSTKTLKLLSLRQLDTLEFFFLNEIAVNDVK